MGWQRSAAAAACCVSLNSSSAGHQAAGVRMRLSVHHSRKAISGIDSALMNEANETAQGSRRRESVIAN
jgi:hypothetical protein